LHPGASPCRLGPVQAGLPRSLDLANRADHLAYLVRRLPRLLPPAAAVPFTVSRHVTHTRIAGATGQVSSGRGAGAEWLGSCLHPLVGGRALSGPRCQWVARGGTGLGDRAVFFILLRAPAQSGGPRMGGLFAAPARRALVPLFSSRSRVAGPLLVAVTTQTGALTGRAVWLSVRASCRLQTISAVPGHLGRAAEPGGPRSPTASLRTASGGSGPRFFPNPGATRLLDPAALHHAGAGRLDPPKRATAFLTKKNSGHGAP